MGLGGFNHGLSDNDLITVANTILNWGAADMFLGYSLGIAHKVADKESQRDLIHAMDLRKKIDLLVRLAKRGKMKAEIETMIRELNSVHGLWSDDRNHISHGFGQLDKNKLPQIVSAKRERVVPASDLNRFYQRSLYILELAVRINLGLSGVNFPPFGALQGRPE